MSYKPEINLANCNPNIYKSLERTACNTSRGGKKKRRTQKGGNRCLVPKNPTPSSYWPGPPNPAPPNPVPSPSCQLPHFRPLVLSQFGGNPYQHPDFYRRNNHLVHYSQEDLDYNQAMEEENAQKIREYQNQQRLDEISNRSPPEEPLSRRAMYAPPPQISHSIAPRVPPSASRAVPLIGRQQPFIGHPDSRLRSTRRSRRITAMHTRENGTTGGKKYKRHTRKAKKYKRHTYKR